MRPAIAAQCFPPAFRHGFENFLQTFDVSFRLFEVFFESGTEFLGFGFFRKFG